MKTIIAFAFAIIIGSGPAFAWGGSDCPFSKNGADQETTSKEVEESNSSRQN